MIKDKALYLYKETEQMDIDKLIKKYQKKIKNDLIENHKLDTNVFK